MKVKPVQCLLVACLGAALSAQNIVTMPQKRQDTLDKLEAVLAHEPIDWPTGDVKRVSPFIPVEVVVEAAPRETPRSQTAPRPARSEPVASVRLSDRAALDAILPSFTPRGTIVMGKRRLLRMSDRKKCEEGDVLAYNVQGETYHLVVEKVTIDGYILRLGKVRVQRSFKTSE